MGALILILPALAFDIWLGATIGRQQVRRWIQTRAWPRFAGVCLASIAAAICLLLIRYQWDTRTRVVGFPIPTTFFNLEDKTWTRSTPPDLWRYIGAATDVITGIALPLIPYKIAEFIRMVKREINR